MERYNFKLVEEKWQNFWDKNKVYKKTIDKSKKKILLLRNVSVPVWENTHGPC